ncbi:MAG: SUMF1/EgtB/PvdO family nonheme iron enzyme [Symploca sp. SIO1C4]|uniref:SUMF1/EgtB/PvdO family nonheme iron enzyme n=1 Tax=Symploca sp. SIO1C4 TaxID=2607765 RepID=A0A6B3NI06_9CYAN|nr:SUMF1/EgtB/PvdO family nonheme iron enzyme [Symploca sp. SIO1C4]
MLLRIDENREIDTSYITCAEYQLFIDEKLKVGEYRQPPHWKTSRFAPGDAHQPITGVKASDAEAFCEWLIQCYPAPGFKYRLPTLTEAHEYPAKEKQMGCWCNHGEKKAITEIEVETTQWQHWQDNLYGSLYDDLIRAYDSVLKLISNHAEVLEKSLNSVNNSVGEGKLLLNHVLTDNFVYDFVNDLDFAVSRSYQFNRARRFVVNPKIILTNFLLVTFLIIPAIFFVIAVILVLTWITFSLLVQYGVIIIVMVVPIVVFIIVSIRFINHIYKWIQNTVNTLDVFFPATHLALTLQKSQERTFKIDNFSTYVGNLKNIRSYLLLCYILWDLLLNTYEKVSSNRKRLQARNLTREDCETFRLEYARKRDDTWNIYTSFLLIGERRKGNIPAWEGIRIVRERI